jgi:hypothetical protein
MRPARYSLDHRQLENVGTPFMFRKIGPLALLTSVTWFNPGALAQDAQPAQRCAEIESDARRLACYDGIFGPPARTAPAELPSTLPLTDSASTGLVERDFRDFGLSEADKRRNTNLPAAPDSISLTIESVGRWPTGEQIFRTREGQVWVEAEPYSRVRVGPGDPVTIRKGAIGSYVLVTSSRAGTKVRRLN